MASDDQFDIFEIWEQLGTTEHLGGIEASRQLLRLCHLAPGKCILDIGCGTGYTACLLAQEYQAKVVAADISPKVLEWARKRVEAKNLADRIEIREANVEALPFPDGTFDLVMTESLLVHCELGKAIGEIYRVLKQGGVFGGNEMTYLRPPPPELVSLLSRSPFGRNIRFLQQHEWMAVLEEVGFVDVFSTLHRISMKDQLISHMRVDGFRKYVSALLRGISNPSMSGPFLTKEMLGAWRKYLEYVGYGLYVGRRMIPAKTGVGAPGSVRLEPLNPGSPVGLDVFVQRPRLES